MKLGRKLMIVFVTVGILPAAAIASLSYWQSSTAIERATFDKLNAVRAIKKND